MQPSAHYLDLILTISLRDSLIVSSSPVSEKQATMNQVKRTLRNFPSIRKLLKTPIISKASMSHASTLTFANIFQSHEDMQEPEIISAKGNLPKWLQGTFMFTGPGVFDIGREFTVNNIADGYAVIGKFDIGQDKVSFYKKILKSDAYLKASKAGRTVLPEYGTKSSSDPTKGYFSKLKIGQPEVSDNANHGIFTLGTEIFVSNGQTYFFSIDKTTLEIKKKYDAKNLFNLQSFAAHPYVDHKDGCIFNIGVQAGATIGARHVITKIVPNPEDNDKLFSTTEILTKVPGSKQPMLISSCTSFGITDNFIIAIESPAFLNLAKYASYLLTGSNYCLFDLADWFPEFRNKFHIIDRHSGKVIRSNITSEVGFIYIHYINCYETNDGYIVIDMVTAPTMNPIHNTTIANLRNDVPVAETSEQGAIQRFKVPLEPVLDFNDYHSESETPQEIVLSPETMSERGVTGVCPNHELATKKYRYCYGTGNITRGPYANSLIKFDLEEKEHGIWKEEHCVINEASFIANPEGHEEDDGVLICGVCSTHQDLPHFLLFLNAQDMTEITRVQLQNTIPIYTHGLFIPTSKC